MGRRLAALVAMASLAAMLAAPAGASALPPAWPELPVGPFPHSRDGNNTTNETDATPPALVVTSHRDNETVKEARISLRGTASDTGGLRAVEVSVNGGAWSAAAGDPVWSLSIRLEEGKNTVSVRAIDLAGNAARQNLSLVLDTSANNNSGILLSAAVIVPLVALIVLFSLRRRAPPAGEETAEEHDGLEKRLGLEGKPRDETGAGLANPEEVTRLDRAPPGKKG
jgi:hypothetical protein